MKQINKLSVIILLLTFVACTKTSENKSVKTNENNWKTLTQNGYTIKFPENWNLKKIGEMGSEFVIFSELTSPKDNFKENVNLLTQNLSGMNIDLDKFVKISEEQINTMLNEGKLIESNRQKSNNSEFHKFIYSSKMNSETILTEQYFWVRKEKAYILTFSCKNNEYKYYQKTGEEILNSFVFN